MSKKRVFENEWINQWINESRERRLKEEGLLNNNGIKSRGKKARPSWPINKSKSKFAQCINSWCRNVVGKNQSIKPIKTYQLFPDCIVFEKRRKKNGEKDQSIK